MSGDFEKNYCEAMSKLRFSTTDKERLCQKLAEAEAGRGSEALFMKKHRIYKIMATAAVCLFLTGAAAFAGANIVNTVTSSASGYEYKSAEELNSAADSALAVYPEELGNGFAFAGGDILESKGQDASANTVETWQELSATYTNEDGTSVELTLSPHSAATAEETKIATAQKEIAGVEVSYNYDEYLFVPSDYELSSAEKERRQTDAHFFVSFGTDSAETQYLSSVSFTKDGLICIISSFDDVSAATLYAMAEELLQK